MSMQRGKKIPTKPRFDYVTKTAYEFLLEYGYDRFPISPFKVLEDISEHVRCLSWSDARTILKSKDPFHLHEINAEARTIRRRDNGLYFIIYDDMTVNSSDRISWTIMHEIGHIVLGHLIDFGETCLDRGGLTKKDYGTLEVEAHYFAAEVLMPTAILKYFRDITIEEISLLFGVSEEAAKKKHNRVFATNYLPTTIYEDKLIRNFYDFLESDLEDTVYKSIYRQWGMPWKQKYISVCRKCPSCLTYISDPSAKYCYHCGAEIETKRTYRNMFDRLSDRQLFTKKQGFSHPVIPYDEVKLGSSDVEKLQFCPECFNKGFHEDAKYCGICGEPLFNRCTSCNKHLRLIASFCPECGAPSSFQSAYERTEKRLLAIRNFPDPQRDAEWMVYPYWGYTKMKLSSLRHKAAEELAPALLFSKAFLADDDGLIVYVDTDFAGAIIHKHKDRILEYATRSDGTEHPYMEVYVKHDL